MTLDPDRAKRHTTTPVSTATASPDSSMRNAASGFLFAATTSNGPSPVAAPGASAWALHLTEPSGHHASGQLCSGSSLFERSRSANDCAVRCRPRGQGVPHVVPRGRAGARSSSQRTQLPLAGFGATAGGGLAVRSAALAARFSAAVVAAVVERNCRREIFPLMLTPPARRCASVIENGLE